MISMVNQFGVLRMMNYDILGRELYEELMESGDIDRPNMYNFGYFRMHISHNFSDKAKQILKQRFLEN